MGLIRDNCVLTRLHNKESGNGSLGGSRTALFSVACRKKTAQVSVRGLTRNQTRKCCNNGIKSIFMEARKKLSSSNDTHSFAWRSFNFSLHQNCTKEKTSLEPSLSEISRCKRKKSAASCRAAWEDWRADSHCFVQPKSKHIGEKVQQPKRCGTGTQVASSLTLRLRELAPALSELPPCASGPHWFPLGFRQMKGKNR
jgi:hypothetical protein